MAVIEVRWLIWRPREAGPPLIDMRDLEVRRQERRSSSPSIAIEEDAPLANSESPKALRATRAFDVPGREVGRLLGRCARDPFRPSLGEGLRAAGRISIRIRLDQSAFNSASASDHEMPGSLRASLRARRSSSVSFLVVVGSGVQFGRNGVLGTSKQNRHDRQGLVGERIHKPM